MKIQICKPCEKQDWENYFRNNPGADECAWGQYYVPVTDYCESCGASPTDPDTYTKEQAEKIAGELQRGEEIAQGGWTYHVEDSAMTPGRYTVAIYDESRFFVDFWGDHR